jgi:polyphosphate kinase
VLFPVASPQVRAALRDGVLFAHQRDTAKAWRLLADGSYEKVSPKEGEKPFSSQEWLLKQGGSWRLEE